MVDAYLAHHIALLKYVRELLVAIAEAEVIPEEHQELLQRYDELIAVVQRGDDELYLGQELMGHVFQHYPQIAHLIPRDLLWFFGGECLHFMPDEEIALFQQLEERRCAALDNDEPFDWNAEVQMLFMPAGPTAH